VSLAISVGTTSEKLSVLNTWGRGRGARQAPRCPAWHHAPPGAETAGQQLRFAVAVPQPRRIISGGGQDAAPVGREPRAGDRVGVAGAALLRRLAAESVTAMQRFDRKLVRQILHDLRAAEDADDTARAACGASAGRGQAPACRHGALSDAQASSQWVRLWGLLIAPKKCPQKWRDGRLAAPGIELDRDGADRDCIGTMSGPGTSPAHIVIASTRRS
jgi:hypothetical protein